MFAISRYFALVACSSPSRRRILSASLFLPASSAGRITEEEFDAALDAIMEEEGLAGEEMLEQYSIDENYERDIDEWDAQGRPDGEVFILGSTGDVLQGLGAMEQDNYLRSEKVNTTANAMATAILMVSTPFATAIWLLPMIKL